MVRSVCFGEVEPDIGAGATQATRTIRALRGLTCDGGRLSSRRSWTCATCGLRCGSSSTSARRASSTSSSSIRERRTFSLAFRQSPFGCRFGRLPNQGWFTSAPQKKQNSPFLRFVAAPGSKTPLLQPASLASPIRSGGVAARARGGLIVRSKKRVKRKSFADKRFGVSGWSQIVLPRVSAPR